MLLSHTKTQLSQLFAHYSFVFMLLFIIYCCNILIHVFYFELNDNDFDHLCGFNRFHLTHLLYFEPNLYLKQLNGLYCFERQVKEMQDWDLARFLCQTRQETIFLVNNWFALEKKLLQKFFSWFSSFKKKKCYKLI